jgi:hypothetical protein
LSGVSGCVELWAAYGFVQCLILLLMMFR